VTHGLVYTTAFGSAQITGSAFSPDGRRVVVVSSDGNGAVYRATGPEEMVFDAGSVCGGCVGVPLALTADRVVATFVPTSGPDAGKEVVQSWSWSGKPAGSPLVVSSNSCPTDGVDPLGKIAFVAMEDCGQLGNKAWSPQPVQLWNIAGRKVVKTLKSTGGALPEYPEINDDGSSLVETVDFKPRFSQPALDLIDVATGKTTRLPLPCFSRYHSSAVSDDGTRVVALSGCPYVLAWRITTNGPIAYRLPLDLTDSSGPLRFSPDGKTIAIANMNGFSQTGIVDATSGKLLATLQGHTDRIVDTAFSPDGKLLVTASLDGTAGVWDAKTGRLLRTLNGPTPLFGVAFSPDGRTIATMDSNGVIRLWDACTDCENADALMALAKTRVTRQLTLIERRTYLGS
jgi:WD40 repeat protein